MEAAIVTTYRCPNRCYMCNIWKYPTKIEDEFNPEILLKLPKLSFCNITGGEPFVRQDIGEIVAILRKNTAEGLVLGKRISISTGSFKLFKEAIESA